MHEAEETLQEIALTMQSLGESIRKLLSIAPAEFDDDNYDCFEILSEDLEMHKAAIDSLTIRRPAQ